MATVSQLVTDADIQKFRDSIAQYKLLRDEIQLAIQAGFTPEYTLADIDKKIKDTIKVIETYTGTRYIP